MSRIRVIRVFLEVLGAIAILGSLVGALVELSDLSRTEAPTSSAYATILLRSLAILTGGGLLWGVAALLGALEGVRQRRESGTANADQSVDSEPQQPGTLPSHSIDELAVLLREVRDISLLDGDQRRMRLEMQGHAALEVLQRDVPALLREHNWIEARHRVQDSRARFPMIREIGTLEHQIEQMRSQVENADIEHCERQIDDLIQLGAWDRVAEVVTELLKRHPDSHRAIELSQKIRVQKNSAEAEQRAKTMAQAQEASNKRDWKTALALANIIVQRYPKSPEAQAVRMQLPTLRENAEIQTRKQLELQYSDSVQAHRYGDALRLAKEIIDQYPNSPQAEALRGQLARLRDAAGAAAA